MFRWAGHNLQLQSMAQPGLLLGIRKSVFKASSALYMNLSG